MNKYERLLNTFVSLVLDMLQPRRERQKNYNRMPSNFRKLLTKLRGLLTKPNKMLGNIPSKQEHPLI